MQIQNKAPYLFRPSQILRRICHGLEKSTPDTADVLLPWGLEMTVNPKETIGRTIWNSGIHELPVCEVLFRLAGRDETAVDAGANIGLMTGLLAAKIGPGGRVYAFEAHPGIYEKLCRHREIWKIHPLAEILALQKAVSSSPGKLPLISGSGFVENQGISRVTNTGNENQNGSSILVEATTLDLELPETCRVGVMKIDVEGHELEVLKGAKRLLAAGSVRDILFEDSGGALNPVMEMLCPLGFSLLEIDWSLWGPSFSPVKSGENRRPGNRFDLPNYLATLEPARAVQLLKPRGWRCLHPKGVTGRING